MEIDLGIVFAVVAGAGTVLGTIAATEQYLLGKFRGAVLSVLHELEYDRKLRHLERNREEHAVVLAKLQDSEIQLYALVNAQSIRMEKLRGVARALTADKPAISAILMDTEAR